MNGSILELHVNRQPEHQAEHAEQQPDQQQVVPVDAQES